MSEGQEGQQNTFTINGYDNATVNVTGQGDIYAGRQPSARPAARVPSPPQPATGNPPQPAGDATEHATSEPATGNVPQSATGDPPQPAGSRLYDVCLSFAGEQRDYVQQVADGLVARGIAVFYDAYEAANLWGRHLPQHLAWVYGEAARYCVVFASEAYARKVWTNHELRSAQARALTEQSGYILPARFDDTPIPGIHDGIGYADLRTLDPEDLVDFIAAKLDQPCPEGHR